MRGLPVGLRLSIDNAISNAVRHGGARHVSIGAHRNDDGTVTVTVDDGTEPAYRTRRGSRCSSASARQQRRKGRLGLGLALVAQQAGLHGGTAHLADTPPRRRDWW
ncbi:hypothetical protein GS436_09035 [Rhodococcus hoagii]|nr:hypothetical protein [Prescottella equi]